MVRWITKKGKDGENRHIPIQEGYRKRERQIKINKQSLDDILNNLQWHEDTDYAYTETGEDEAKTYHAFYDGYYIKVYPVSLVQSGEKGWEYEIINDEKGIQYNSLIESSNRNDHAKTSEEAKKWAIDTLKTFLEED
jgi:hypothetical protein